MAEKVITRFAPSPTGFLHIGGIRTALYAYLWARKSGGEFILRIEDTDKEREVPGSIEHIQESLKWLRLEWDYGPDKPGPFGSVIQSDRLPTYTEWAHKLIEKGLAYPDPYTPDEVDAFRKKAQEEKRPFLFRDYRPHVFEKWDGTKPLRYKVPEIKRYIWTDLARGELEAGEEALDDFILIKSDGYPTYNFAHIIDDFNMGVTHIMRADEFISSTPKFLSLYDGLGFKRPEFVTLPPILRDDRTKKLGKRDGAKDILDYRAEGYLPQAMINYLALIGWNPGTDQEIFTMEELVEQFDLSKIQKGGAVFDEKKLRWVNKEHIKRLPKQELDKIIRDKIEASFPGKDISAELADVIAERIETFSDIDALIGAGELDYFFAEPTLDKAKISWKGIASEETVTHLAKVAELVEAGEDVMPYAESAGKGNVLWPLRYALSGREKSPDPFTLLKILGKDESLKRTRKAAELLNE